MDVPELVREKLGNEAVEAGVNLGDEDVVCLTPTRTLLYRGEGLLSDEKVEEYGHDVERLSVKEGRRKTKFVLEYVDGNRSFAVPSNRESQVLELLFEGILREAGVVGPDERVQGAFRFSELALVVTDARVVKHIGAAVWSDDHEVYPFADLTGLSFERGSVATELVLEIDGRPQRIKTPNEQAHKVQQVTENAAFEYHGVDSLSALNAALAPEDDGDEDATGSASGDIDLGAGIDPLVSDDEDDGSEGKRSSGTTAESGPLDEPDRIDTEPGDGHDQASSAESSGSDTRTANTARGREGSRTGANDQSSEQPGGQSAGRSGTRDQTASGGPAGGEAVDAAAVEEQLAELTTAVQKQNELLQRQHKTIKQLIEELRQGRG